VFGGVGEEAAGDGKVRGDALEFAAGEEMLDAVSSRFPGHGTTLPDEVIARLCS
jgi:hypothetical protein